MTDNVENRGTSQEWDDSLIMGLRRGLPEHSGDAEGILVSLAGAKVMLTLEDGEMIELDRVELMAALQPPLRVLKAA
jgi:hypothetical protein